MVVQSLKGGFSSKRVQTLLSWGKSSSEHPPRSGCFHCTRFCPHHLSKAGESCYALLTGSFQGPCGCFSLLVSGFIPVHSQGAGAVMVLTQFYRAQAEATGLFWGSAPLNTKPFKGTSRNKKEDFTITKYSLVKASPFYN